MTTGPIFVDCETTSLEDGAEVLEVALISPDGWPGFARVTHNGCDPLWPHDGCDPRLVMSRGLTVPFCEGSTEEIALWTGDDVDLSRASSDSLRINRYYERLWTRKSWTEKTDVGARIVAELTAGRTLAGNNVAFDARILAGWLRRHGQCPSWDYRLLEVVDYAAGALGLVPPWGSRTVAEALGVPLPGGDEAHTALADARWARRVFEAARARVPAVVTT
jgi:hypothetical protein